MNIPEVYFCWGGILLLARLAIYSDTMYNVHLYEY